MDERHRILEMLQQGKVTVDEAAKLLAAVDAGAPRPGPRVLRIRVVTSRGDVSNVNVPVGLAKTVLKLLPERARMLINEQQVDLHELVDGLVNGSASGKLVDVVSGGGDHIEISID